MILENIVSLNILTEPEVISAAITAFIGAIAGITTSIFSWIAGSGRRKARHNLRVEHLIQLYEPLEELLFFEKYDCPNELLTRIHKLVSANYRYATPILVDTILELKNKDKLEEQDFHKLRIITAALYNWYRKKLGYSYAKHAINRYTRKYLPSRFAYNINPLDILATILMFLSLALLISAIGYASVQLIKLINTLILPIILISLFVLIFKLFIL